MTQSVDEWAASLTASQVEIMLHFALKAEDMPAVATCMRLMSAKDPKRAEMLLDVIDVALALGRKDSSVGSDSTPATKED